MPRISQQVELPGLAAGVPGKGSADGQGQGDGFGGLSGLRLTTKARLSPAPVEADAHKACEH